MKKFLLLPVLVFFGLALTFTSPAEARKADVDATLCNASQKPVEFKFYNSGDPTEGLVPLFRKSVRACSCVEKTTKTNSRIQLPHANVKQLVYREVKAESSQSIKVCVGVKGEFEGYIDAKVKTCVEAKKTKDYLPAPELTHAQGDVDNLETQMHPTDSSCRSRNDEGKCLSFTAKYIFTDGVQCYGNTYE